MDKTINNSIESKLDTLWRDVKEYRTSEHFCKVMQACKKFHNLAPYNAMLVEMQRPSAKYVLTQEEWRKKYDREIKPNARPIIILVPFGPVDFLFDVSDTYPTDLFKKSEDDILEDIASPFKTKKEVSDTMLNSLISQLAIHSIAIDNCFIAGAGYGARLELLENDSHKIYLRIKQHDYIMYAKYLLSVNKNSTNGSRYANICHELGHLFCFHLSSPKEWKGWQTRQLSEEAIEFEAESVAWIVCERLGIGKTSAKYLSGYLDEHGEIPSHVSIERILSAAKDVLKMCNSNVPLNYKEGLLYRYCDEFKNITKKL